LEKTILHDKLKAINNRGGFMKKRWHELRLKYLNLLLEGAIDSQLRGKLLDKIDYHSRKANKT